MDEISTNLRSLKMPGMAHFWQTLQETRRHDELSLKDGLQMMILAELDNRTMSRNARLLKRARFRYQASVDQLIFDPARGLDRQTVLNLATCDYIRHGVAVIITGAAGTGKSWLASALGHQACMNGLKVLDSQQLLDFMEIIEDRHGKKATIIVSQLPVSDWHDILQKNTTAADAILDRLVHTAVRIELKGDSMRRKKTGKENADKEK